MLRPTLLLAALTLWGTAVAAKPAADRPNVLVLFTDDQGVGDVGCYGSEIPHAARRLAGRGRAEVHPVLRRQQHLHALLPGSVC